MAHHYALFSALYWPHVGGVESFTSNVAHALVAGGDRATVVTSRLDESSAHEIQDDGVEVVRLPAHVLMDGRLPVSKKDATYKRRLAELVEAGCDRVLVNTRFYRHSLEGLRFARLVGAPAIVLDHGSDYVVLGNPVLDATLRWYEHAMTARGRRYHPRYAAVSRRSTAWLRTFGIETDVVIPDAIDAKSFRDGADGTNMREALHVGDGQRLVAFVGRLIPEKGALQLARAARLLGDGYVVAFAGEGPLREDIAALGQPHVRLLGSLSRGQVSALMRDADLFCLPSRSEGFCIAYLEACAWGLRSVMPRVGVVEEVLDDASCFGALVPNTEPQTLAGAVRAVLESCPRGHSRELMQLVEHRYSWQASAQALRDGFA